MTYKIKYQNISNGPIYEKTKEELENMMKEYNDYKIMYKNFELHICCPKNCYWYCGYITKFHEKLNKTITNKELENYYNIDDITHLHGGFTYYQGFHCAHAGDILLWPDIKNDSIYNGWTFKTHLFVESELKKLVDNIIECSDN